MRPLDYLHVYRAPSLIELWRHWLWRHWRPSLAVAAAAVVAGVQAWGWGRVGRLLGWLWHAGWPIAKFAALPLAAAGVLYVATSAAGRRWWRRQPWHAVRPVAQPAWLPVVVAGIVAVLAGMVLLAPGWLVARDTTVNTLTAEQRAKATSDARTALLQAVGGLLLAAGAATTWRQMRISREGQVTERFTRAVDQLGSEHLDVRLGGLYALERIARDSPDDRRTIAEVLTAYIRHRAPWPPAKPGQYRADVPLDRQPDLRTRAPDVQAALTVLARGPFPKPVSHEAPRAGRLDLREVDLRKADLVSAHLEGAWLDRAHLEGAWLDRVHLVGAWLVNAHLEGAELGGAHLEDAWLAGARLEGAQLAGAHLEQAWLGGGVLLEAGMLDTLLEEGRLVGPHPEGVLLDRANLQGAQATRGTVWPKGFSWREAGVVQVDYSDVVVNAVGQSVAVAKSVEPAAAEPAARAVPSSAAPRGGSDDGSQPAQAVDDD
jgi:hypothetical protein